MLWLMLCLLELARKSARPPAIERVVREVATLEMVGVASLSLFGLGSASLSHQVTECSLHAKLAVRVDQEMNHMEFPIDGAWWAGWLKNIAFQPIPILMHASMAHPTHQSQRFRMLRLMARNPIVWEREWTPAI